MISDKGLSHWKCVKLIGLNDLDPGQITCDLDPGQITYHNTELLLYSDMSRFVRKPVLRFPTRSDTNWAVQPQKMARGLKFPI